MDSIFVQVLLLAAGFVLLIKGADWFVDGAAGLAVKAGIPQIVIGLTIVAMGTSAPEAAISISSSVKGSADIAVGNVLGSNIVNVLLILGITAVIIPLAIRRSTIRYEIPFVIIITGVFALLGLPDGVLSLTDGLILWALFVLYLIYLFRMAKKGEPVAEEIPDSKKKPLWLLLILLVAGVAMIIFGSNLTIDAATWIARYCGMSERVIGLTVIAFGTSLPELVTCIMAARKKNVDLAIGNIVGSNIFNILFVIGTSALITPVVYQRGFLIDSIAAIAVMVLLLVLVLNRERKLKRWGGLIMLACYAGYFVYLFLK